MNLRILSTALLAVTASVLWMAVGTASATVLTSPSGTAYTGTLVAEAEGHVVLDNPIAKIECASKVEGAVETHGAEVTAGGKISSLSFTGCTDSWHVTVVAAGSLEVHDVGGGVGTVTSSGATVEATRFGITCRYATSSTDIGTFTGGTPATLHISAAIPFHSGSIFCGSSATNWTGSYKITTPSPLLLVPGAELRQTVTFEGKLQEANECKFEKAKIKTQVCKVEFKVVGAGGGVWTVKKSEFIPANSAEQFEATVGCTKNKELKAGGAGCTDEIKNIKNEAFEATWCVTIAVPGGGEGPNCTFLKK